MTSLTTTGRLAIHGGEPVRRKPFAPNCLIGGRERELLLEAFESSAWSEFRAGAQGHDIRVLTELPSAEALEFGDGDALFLGGRWVRRLEAAFAAHAGTRYAVACNSATSGLVMAAGALDLMPGDEVLVPCMTFHATATALVPWGAVPVFVEVKPDTFCIDPADAAAKITPRTRAIMVVHLGGTPAAMDEILALARAHGLRVIEDCAQALGARYRGREVGSIGDCGVYSLTETKSITCGEGGVVVTDDPRIARKARLIRNHGEGVAGENWSEADLINIVGMNFRLTELQAALAIAQLEQLAPRNRARAENAAQLAAGLARWPMFVRQSVEPGGEPAWFVFKMRYVAAAGMPSRDELVTMLAAEGIPTVAGYARLLYENPLFARRGPRYGNGTCPRSEALNRELVWFPFIHPPNDRADMEDVTDAVTRVLGQS
jgi:dTDP-4-amino-4,6-dideoxygalactose transaminase